MILVEKILVVCFKQTGDSILVSPVCVNESKRTANNKARRSFLIKSAWNNTSKPKPN